ncbi:MAG: septum formation initiator family protein [Gemmatimonadaceae bacterium]
MLRRLSLYFVLAFALYYAVQGGEFTTLHLFRQRSREKMLNESIDSLKHVVDSLQRYKARLRTDPALQERIARETYGMVKSDKELLYRFVDPDSVSRGAGRPK